MVVKQAYLVFLLCVGVEKSSFFPVKVFFYLFSDHGVSEVVGLAGRCDLSGGNCYGIDIP